MYADSVVVVAAKSDHSVLPKKACEAPSYGLSLKVRYFLILHGLRTCSYLGCLALSGVTRTLAPICDSGP